MLDVETMEFTAGPEMQTRRFGCVATPLDDAERVLVIGGVNGTGTARNHLATTEILSVGANEEERAF